jgi:hypothetical protein
LSLERGGRADEGHRFDLDARDRLVVSEHGDVREVRLEKLTDDSANLR